MDFEEHTQQKISKTQWPVLRDLYKFYWPRHILTFYTLRTYIEWVRKNPKLDINIYSSDQNWKVHGTFVLLDQSGPSCKVLFNTLNAEKYDSLLFNVLRNIPTSSPFTLTAFVEEVEFTTNSFILRQKLTVVDRCDTLLFYLPLKESLQLPKKAKPGYIFKQLSVDYVEEINNLWPHRHPGSDILIENIIRYNMTIGAYDEATGELCGWVMQEQIGTIALLQVKDSCKRQGLGEQLVIHMAQLLAAAGMDAIATIMSTNRPSRRLFHKLGFKIIGRVAWQDVLPAETKKVEEKDVNACD